MTVAQDEKLKGACHGLLAGCVLPILAYNLGARNWRNVAIYLGVVSFEAYQLWKHAEKAHTSQSSR